MHVPISSESAVGDWRATFSVTGLLPDGRMTERKVELPIAVWLTMRDFGDVRAGNLVLPGVVVGSCPAVIAVDDLDAILEELNLEALGLVGASAMEVAYVGSTRR